ncbi:MAG TPA: M50 family metallopeptidase [Baekduia sp.]|uniref:M50 family metallopeptidase n=1 Tax=Baekduia sp. TaxID=2600305 RepID=UPI002D77AE3A|nr:M50 family metallopeptidase [Baekduia sp.]HET6506337.1 M50 family metallopeptidase [Baekduia sp.]
MSWFLAALGFIVLIILHELGHFTAAKLVGMRVERFSLFFPPLLGKIKKGETEYAIGAIPAGGYVKITGMNPTEEIPPEHADRAYYRQPVWKRVVVIAAGPFVNVVVAFAILFGLFAFKGQVVASDHVYGVQKDSAAQGVLKPGDKIVSVDGVGGGPADFRKQIGTHTCADDARTDGCVAATAAKVVVVRDGRQQTVEVRPRYDTAAGRMLIGFTFDNAYDRLGPADAASRSVTGMWNVTKGTVSAITKIFYSSEARKNVSGIVGSYETTRESFKADDIVLSLQILAIISLSLAIVNLFPFLPLDGGHIFWALAEKVRGRPIPFRVMEQASYVGFVLVIMLFAVGLTNDINRLAGPGFGVK